MTRLRHPSCLLLAFALSACSTISTFDQAAYASVTSLKVDTLNLVAAATGNYSEHTKEITDLNTRLAKAYEYDRGRPLNQRTMQLWDQLLTETPSDPDSGVLPHFLELWKAEGAVSAAAINGRNGRPGEKARIGQAFDKIIALESGKNK